MYRRQAHVGIAQVDTTVRENLNYCIIQCLDLFVHVCLQDKHTTGVNACTLCIMFFYTTTDHG